MERLVLRGVMWGADKIPDEWFDRIPGSYYKAKTQQKVQEKEAKADMKKRRTRRYSDDEYDEEDDRRSKDDGYRSEGHGSRRSDAKRTHDGAVDDDYDLANDRPRRKRSRQRRRRDDDDRYGHKDGYSRSSRKSGHGVDGVEYGDGAIPPADRPPSAPSHTPSPMAGQSILGNPAAYPAAAAGGFAAQQAFQQSSAYGSPRPSVASSNISPTRVPVNGFNPPPAQPAARSTSTLRGGMATGYVPYAHIYGGPSQQQSQAGFAPPSSDISSIQPTYMNQVAPPVAKQESYQQNPYAQDAPLGTQPGYLPDPNQQNRSQRWNGQYDGRHDDRSKHARYDSESETPPPRDRRRSRRSSRKTRRDRSPSEYSYSDDSRDDRRGRETRKQDSVVAAPPPRSKSTLKGPFDTSQRALGYSAIGALAGGLIGSEFGKGPVPQGIATAVGACAANLWQARERFVVTSMSTIPPVTPLHREQHAISIDTATLHNKALAEAQERSPESRVGGEETRRQSGLGDLEQRTVSKRLESSEVEEAVGGEYY